MLFVNALDPVARIARVAIGLRHQLTDLVLPRRRRAQNSRSKIDNLSDREFMRHKMSVQRSSRFGPCITRKPSGALLRFRRVVLMVVQELGDRLLERGSPRAAARRL